MPENGGGGEYSWGARAALPVPTDNLPLASKMITSLIKDKMDLQTRQRVGRGVAIQYSINKASSSIVSLIQRHINNKEQVNQI